MRRKTLTTVAAFLLISSSLLYLFFGDTAVRQARRVKLARTHVPKVIQSLGSYPEFSSVKAEAGTAAGGCLMVVGRVSTQGEIERLKGIVAETQPPVEVWFNVIATNANVK